MDRVEQIVRTFLGEYVLEPEQVDALDRKAHLIKLGILNSLTLTRLVACLESEMDTKIDPSEFEIEHFETIEAICNFMNDKLSR